MKRKVSRHQWLPAFRIDLNGAEALERELLAVFPADVYSSVTITVGGEEFAFNNVAQIRDAPDAVPNIAHEFSLRFIKSGSDDPRFLLLTTSFNRPLVSVESPDYGWCAGAVAICERAAHRGRRWYSWLRHWHLWLLATVSFVFLTGRSVFKVEIVSSALGLLSWTLSTVLLWALFFGFSYVFPAASLVVRAEERWFKRHLPELTLILTLLALLVAALDLLFK